MINYYLLTKPGIILGNLVTVAAGFLLASKGHVNILLFVQTMLGLAFIIASACVFNNYIDIPLDQKMSRTRTRPLATGLVSGPEALAFGTLLGFIGGLILYVYTNPLTLLVAASGFFVYVLLYSIWKKHTIYGTAIGSIAGAVPPVVGYCAVSNRFDLGAVILFLMMILWQMPHFFAIAMNHLDDYTRANIPVLPVIKGIRRTKLHMLLYIFAFILVSISLTFFNYTGYIYLFITLAFSMVWLGLCVIGFKTENDRHWSRQMFIFSLLLITAISVAIPIDVVQN